MTSSNFAYALDQELPALPKWLFVLLADGHGLSERYDVPRDRYMVRTGMTAQELEAALLYLDDKQYLKIIKHELPDGIAGWTVLFTYPGEYSQNTWAEQASPRPPRQRDQTPGWLYIIGTAHDISKVGITTDLPSRVNSLITNAAVDAVLAWSHQCPISDARDFESALLQHFAPFKFKGEWLRKPSEDVIAVAKTMVERGPP